MIKKQTHLGKYPAKLTLHILFIPDHYKRAIATPCLFYPNYISGH